MQRRWVAAVLGASILTGCGSSAGQEGTAVAPTSAPTTAAPTTAAPTTTLPPTTAAPTTTTTLFTPLPDRVVVDQAWTPALTVGGITIVHPSSRVEHIGFHESSNDGARRLEPLPTAIDPVVLESRERGNDPQTAADIVVDPAVEIRAPVTGTVLRGGGYTLYCDYSDHYVVIEPDEHPGWEVKILHIADAFVGRGDRVVAGETVIAPGPTLLPFPSQVDEVATAKPPWPHVHIEVVDPSIPDRPGPGC